MSAQGATLGGRGTALHLPIWPVAVLVAAIAAVTIGVTMIGEQSLDATRPFRLTGEAANSTTAIREGGVVVPVAVGISHVTPKAVGVVGLENPGAYATQLPAFAGLENPGAYVTELPAYAGFENPGAYPPAAAESGDFSPTIGARPGMTGEKICGQCR